MSHRKVGVFLSTIQPRPRFLFGTGRVVRSVVHNTQATFRHLWQGGLHYQRAPKKQEYLEDISRSLRSEISNSTDFWLLPYSTNQAAYVS